MELKKNWNSSGNIAGGDRLQLLGFCLGQTYSMYHPHKDHPQGVKNRCYMLQVPPGVQYYMYRCTCCTFEGCSSTTCTRSSRSIHFNTLPILQLSQTRNFWSITNSISRDTPTLFHIFP